VLAESIPLLNGEHDPRVYLCMCGASGMEVASQTESARPTQYGAGGARKPPAKSVENTDHYPVLPPVTRAPS
jgi:hypothetical protein